jgi:hypothetical protein
LRGALDIAFRLQAVVALVNSLPGTARSSTFELSGGCGHERFGRYVFCVTSMP